ncbi:hypothetical protein IEQ34_013886 [Dendrobium chrysotoxum]|uniref:Uncharacterized protein n=1 Tax=Dendrobium chrysotoxum TaxID=161865 RepID=A0AAV7GRE9_DENCH|nr:hypothetical protein IEQ34_013886 [Dendrobium chrysotoxum]
MVVFRICLHPSVDDIQHATYRYHCQGIVSHAKMPACVLIVHLMLTLSVDSAECIAVPMIGGIRLIQNKWRQNPSFSALEQYSFQGYSDGKKLLAMGRLSSKLNKTVKFFLMVLLMSMEFNNPGETINDDSGLDNNQLAETSLAIGRLLPVLCKYVERTECFDLSVASMDLMLRSFFYA